MLRSILVLNLPGAVRTKLQSMGYEYVEDIEKILTTNANIPTRLKTIIDEYKIADKILLTKTCEIISAASLWHNEFSNPPVQIFHEGLDKLLDGGLPVGRITELCGPPGCGKTQLCLQFCVDVQIPSFLGGSGGEALYISTNFGFEVDRLREIIQGSIQHCHSIKFSTEKEKEKEILKSLTPETLLDGVNVLQIYQLNHLVESLKNLNTYLETNQQIKLLIIDSFSLPFVVEVEDLLIRSKIIANMLDILLDNAIKYKLAVVLTNQLSTIIAPNNKVVLKPSLGEGFGHRLHQRLLLDKGVIYLTKSIKHSLICTSFEITKEGIR